MARDLPPIVMWMDDRASEGKQGHHAIRSHADREVSVLVASARTAEVGKQTIRQRRCDDSGILTKLPGA